MTEFSAVPAYNPCPMAGCAVVQTNQLLAQPHAAAKNSPKCLILQNIRFYQEENPVLTIKKWPKIIIVILGLCTYLHGV